MNFTFMFRRHLADVDKYSRINDKTPIRFDAKP